MKFSRRRSDFHENRDSDKENINTQNGNIPRQTLPKAKKAARPDSAFQLAETKRASSIQKKTKEKSQGSPFKGKRKESKGPKKEQFKAIGPAGGGLKPFGNSLVPLESAILSSNCKLKKYKRLTGNLKCMESEIRPSKISKCTLRQVIEELFTERFLFETQDIRSEFIANNRNYFSKAAQDFPDFVYLLLTKKYKNLVHAEHVTNRNQIRLI